MKVLVFLSLIGEKIYLLWRDLISFEKLVDKNFVDIVKLLKDYLFFKLFVIVERFWFNCR